MKTLVALLLAGLWLLPNGRADDTPVTARALLRKALEPVVTLFTHPVDSPTHAWVLRVRLAESNIHPPELLGSSFVLKAEVAPADKILFSYPALGTTITICRQGQSIWASPASRLAPILQQVEANPPTAADRKPMAALRMPVPEALFWVGFYLTPVKDLGSQSVGGVNCRVLDVDPPDENGKVSTAVWTRLFIRPDTGQIVRFDRRHGTDRSTYFVEQSRVLAALPDSEFQPTPAQHADLLEVPAERFRAFMKAVGDEEEKRRKEYREHHQP